MQPLAYFARKQQGAALVIGLLLLLVLTVLAVSGMNSASVEFLMAGNDQFRQNAFQASEAGIERALSSPGSFDGTTNAVPPIVAAVPGSATDSFTANIAIQLGGCTMPVFGSDPTSGGTAFQYDVQSLGVASRNSSATHRQGVAVIASAAASSGYFTGTCGGGGGGGAFN